MNQETQSTNNSNFSTFLIGVYGSLRPGMYNFQRFTYHYENEIKHLKTITLPSFNLFDLPFGYPAIKKSENENDKVVFDILEVSENCYKDINRMEIGAGYELLKIPIKEIKDLKNDNLKHEFITVYLYTREVLAIKKIKNGDYLKHKVKSL